MAIAVGIAATWSCEEVVVLWDTSKDVHYVRLCLLDNVWYLVYVPTCLNKNTQKGQNPEGFFQHCTIFQFNISTFRTKALYKLYIISR